MASTDDILLRLVIKGMDPAEVTRLAQQTYGQLKTEAAKYIEQLSALHKQKQKEMTDDQRASVEAGIKEQQKALQAVQQMMRQQEIAVNQARVSMDRWLERLENITTVLRGAWDVMSAGWGRFKDLAEQIDKTTNVYGALQGSIEQMRVASGGEISDMDLILTKNRAMQKDLQLTDAQFGAVAAAADNFADSLGVNTKEAMDSIIDGLATGRVKMLEHAGVVVKAEEAYAAYSAKIHIAVKDLTDHEKQLAMVEASLKAMDQKLATSGDHVRDFANNWEKVVAQISNLKDHILLGLGNAITAAIEGIAIGIPNSVRIALAKIKDMVPGSSGTHEAIARENFAKEIYQYEHGDAGKSMDAAQKRLATPGAYDQPRNAAAEDAIRASKASAKKTEYAPFGEYDEGIGQRDHQTDAHISNQKEAEYEANYTDFLKEELDKREQMQKMYANSVADAAEISAKASREILRKQEEYHKQMSDQAGAGGFALLAIFGTDGPDGFYRELTYFQSAILDMSGMVSNSAKKMTEALGKSLSAVFSGAEGNKKSIRQITYDTLVGLSEQATVRALFETAEGLASLALGPIGGVSAGMHFAAAAAFGGVGIAAGLGARVVGNPSAGASSAKAPSTSPGLASSSGSSFGSGGQRSSAGSGDRPPVVINLNGVIGGPETGRAVKQALEAYQNLTGELLIGVAA